MKFFRAVFLLLFAGCAQPSSSVDFKFALSDPGMIVNTEQDNRIEGTYLKIIAVNYQDSSLSIELPKSFAVSEVNKDQWNIGWGDHKPYYDNGSENLRSIQKISGNRIWLGGLKRGEGFPVAGDDIVCWNTRPGGFIKVQNRPILDPSNFKGFAGSSVNFSSVVFDSLSSRYYMIFNECDTADIRLYAASSIDLYNWRPENNGDPILTEKDFSNITWAGFDPGGKSRQAPFASELIQHKGSWYLFLDGYDKSGKRHIGLAITNSLSSMKFRIKKDPLISPGKRWNNQSCFYAKVSPYKDGFILFYDGRNVEGEEALGMATSTDLLTWEEYEQNPVIVDHQGWRSHEGSSEPNMIQVRNDSIIVMLAGTKKLKGSLFHNLTGQLGMGRKGNTDDAQLGIYLSTDGGKTFHPHRNNPVMVNDYSDVFENEHMGGNIELIQTDSADYLIYQAKSSYPNLRYNILIREKKK